MLRPTSETGLAKLWSGGRDLNPQPSPWKSETLPLSYPRPVLQVRGVSLLIPANSVPGKNPAGTLVTKLESWWTGKDSNLRSPQGAADLQSAGFSHSPTRPGNFCRDTKLVSAKTARTLTACPLFDCPAVVRERVAGKNQLALGSKNTSPFTLPCP